jgi:hypothetical protein
MEFISSQSDLTRQFKRLIPDYKAIHWATAWAGVGSEPFAALVRAQHKIRRLVVGIHFYQTHPDFIDTFRMNTHVRFIKQPDGTFHPKVYLFYDDADSWELLIGSGNFTNEAFTANTEAGVLVTSDDPNSAAVLKQAQRLLQKSWDLAHPFGKRELDAYRTTWANHRAKLNSLSGRYHGRRHAPSKGRKRASAVAKPIFEAPVAVMPWATFMEKVRKERFHSLSERLAMLGQVQRWLTKAAHFNALGVQQRKFTAGLPNTLNTEEISAGWFGSMKGAGKFNHRITKNDANISRALDAIPAHGEVTRSDYDAFVRHFSKSFPGVWVAPGTRLLAMKRPDTFVCLDSKNRSNLCRDFGIRQSGMDFERYWDEIVERIRDSEWWLHPEPKTSDEQRVRDASARATRS